MSDLLNVLNSDDKELSSKAITVIDLQNSFKAGNISKEEYLELLQDLQRTLEVSEGSSDVALKGVLITGIANLIQLA